VDKDDFRKVASILRPADLTGSMSRMWISTIWLEELANAWPCGGRCLDTLRGVGDPKSETGHYITPSPRAIGDDRHCYPRHSHTAVRPGSY
jgi:hypothetical protein